MGSIFRNRTTIFAAEIKAGVIPSDIIDFPSWISRSCDKVGCQEKILRLPKSSKIVV
jgi:hypothetical protein